MWKIGFQIVSPCSWFKHILFQKKTDYQQAQSLRVAFQKKKQTI